MHARNALADALEGIDAQIKALPNVPPVFKIEEGGANQTKTSQESDE